MTKHVEVPEYERPGGVALPRSYTIVEATDEHEIESVRTLCREYCSSISVDLTSQDIEAEIMAMPGVYGSPRGRLFLAVDESGEALGCVAFKPLKEQGCCEIKRLFVRPAARGTGAGRALLQHALDTASRFGYSHAFLDTVPSMGAAIALYLSLGFERTQAYWNNPVPGVIFFHRPI